MLFLKRHLRKKRLGLKRRSNRKTECPVPSPPLPSPSSPSAASSRQASGRPGPWLPGPSIWAASAPTPPPPSHCLPPWLNPAPHVSSHRLLCCKSENCVSRSIMSDSLWSQGLQPARLLCPWDSPGRNTAVDCHALLQGISGIEPRSPALQADSLSSEPPGKAQGQIKTFNHYILERYFYYIKYLPVNSGWFVGILWLNEMTLSQNNCDKKRWNNLAISIHIL